MDPNMSQAKNVLERFLFKHYLNIKIKQNKLTRVVFCCSLLIFVTKWYSKYFCKIDAKDFSTGNCDSNNFSKRCNKIHSTALRMNVY